jgi:hypothetical protein
MISGCISYKESPVQPTNKISDRQLKTNIVNNYQIGTCHGMPVIVSDEIMNDYLENNQNISKYINKSYNTSSLKEVYNLVMKFNQINIIDETRDTIRFSYTDGNCCTVYSYEGIYNKQTNKIINVTEISNKTIPC